MRKLNSYTLVVSDRWGRFVGFVNVPTTLHNGAPVTEDDAKRRACTSLSACNNVRNNYTAKIVKIS